MLVAAGLAAQTQMGAKSMVTVDGLDGLGTALPDGRSGYDITKRSDEGIIETEGRSGYDITKRSVEEVLKTEGRSGYDITK